MTLTGYVKTGIYEQYEIPTEMKLVQLVLFYICGTLCPVALVFGMMFLYISFDKNCFIAFDISAAFIFSALLYTTYDGNFNLYLFGAFLAYILISHVIYYHLTEGYIATNLGYGSNVKTYKILSDKKLPPWANRYLVEEDEDSRGIVSKGISFVTKAYDTIFSIFDYFV